MIRSTSRALSSAALALPALYLSYYLRELTPGWVFVVYACAPLLVLLPEVLAARSGMRASEGATPATAPGSSVDLAVHGTIVQ